jgi:Ca2+-binding RTX toxin-like protein
MQPRSPLLFHRS